MSSSFNSVARSYLLVDTLYPGKADSNMARLVLPQAEGNAAQMYFLSPVGAVIPTMSMCSASQPSLLAIVEPVKTKNHHQHL